MSRIKLILSIFLMLLLLLLGIILPSYYRKHKEESSSKDGNISVSKEERSSSKKEVKLEYLDFDELEEFFSLTQIESLKAQFSSYFQQKGLDKITSVSFLKDKTSYSGTSTVHLQFSLSDNTMLPVSYDTSTGVFFFGEDRVQVSFENKTYPKPTDDSLPDITTEEIEELQEGGYADTTEVPSSETDAATPVPEDHTKEVQP